MSNLLKLSLGPVQGFIAASRKTRDLKAGSDLLADMGKAVADVLARYPGTKFIFPADPSAKAANVISVLVEDDPQAIVSECKKAIQAFLINEWNMVVSAHGAIFDSQNKELGKQQVSEFPEFFAAWHTMELGYSHARWNVDAALASRKTLRDFGPSPKVTNKPKSPLAPWFDTILPLETGFTISEAVRNRLGFLKGRETLDAVSLIKRLRKLRSGRFPSTREVAASHFLACIPDEILNDIESRLGQDEDLGDLIFNDCPSLANNQEMLRDLRGRLKGATEKPWPRPYFAVLHGDGDSMGRAIDAIGGDPDSHSSFSDTLSNGFSARVDGIVEAHHGFCVYAGGDDVLALLPVETAAECAQALHRKFDDAMGSISGSKPTLSVGIALVHCLENLQSAVEFSANLEHRAKQIPGKNAVAIGARTRSGGDAVFAAAWHSKAVGVFDQILEGITAKGRIPRGFPYEIRELLEDIEVLFPRSQGTASKTNDSKQVEFALGEIKRIAGKKEPVVDPVYYEWIESRQDVEAFRDILLVAHFLTREAE